MLATLVDGWDEMTAEERRRVIDVVFAEIHASSEGIAKILPREDWKPTWQPFYARLSRWPRWGTERKTGVKDAEVITVRLLQNERGWLWLADDTA